MAEKMKFEQLMRQQINPNRNVVLSKSPTGKYSLAQQIEVPKDEGDGTFFVFLKNAIIMDPETLKEFSEKLYEITRNIV